MDYLLRIRGYLFCIIATVILSMIPSCGGKSSDIAQKVIKILPDDGVYSDPVGAGGEYQDPIHGFFSVTTPSGFRITEKRDKSTFEVVEGPFAGETVRRSWVQFRSGDLDIGVIARETATSLEEDFRIVVEGLRKAGVKIYRERFVTIDGAKGGELLGSIKGIMMLTVKYKKDGLDHAITITAPERKFGDNSEIFMDFLRSYRSLGTQ